MNMPGFKAESSLGPTMGIYRGKVRFGGSDTAEVLPMMAKTCGNCERVGGLGGIGGIGIRACSQTVWTYNPITKRYEPTLQQWFERCGFEPMVYWA